MCCDVMLRGVEDPRTLKRCMGVAVVHAGTTKRFTPISRSTPIDDKKPFSAINVWETVKHY